RRRHAHPARGRHLARCHPDRGCLACCCSCGLPQQVDDGEDGDPDDVERVPEQAEAGDAADDLVAESLGPDLRHHRRQPDQSKRHMDAMAADQREEG
nr:hypothetical protein [Tanacetum cinerariifolium]